MPRAMASTKVESTDTTRAFRCASATGSGTATGIGVGVGSANKTETASKEPPLASPL